jgi:fructose-1-phosphate kinase PfkB-like protein
MPEHAFVFAPDPLLTVTVEAGSDGDEIHLNAGGQGFWVAQMIANLGVGVSLCGPVGRLADHIELHPRHDGTRRSA